MDLSAYKHRKMKKRTIHNLVWIPMFLIGMTALALGLEWCFHPEPWLLDQRPNEALLQTSFNTLFAEKINAQLPEYLTVIYRFFGLWLTSIGLLIIAYVQVTRMGTSLARNILLGVMFIVLVGIYYLMLNFIPTSPFLPLVHVLTILWFTSTYFSITLKK